MCPLGGPNEFPIDEKDAVKQDALAELQDIDKDLIDFPDIYLPVTADPHELTGAVKKNALSLISRQHKMVDTRFGQFSGSALKNTLAEIKKHGYIKNPLLQKKVSRVCDDYVNRTQERFSPKQVQTLIEKIRGNHIHLSGTEIAVLREIVAYTQIMLMQNPELMNAVSGKVYLFSQREFDELQGKLDEFSSNINLHSNKIKLAGGVNFDQFKGLLEVFQQLRDQMIGSMIKKTRLLKECITGELNLQKVPDGDDLMISRMNSRLNKIKNNLDISGAITSSSCMDDSFDKDITIANNLVYDFIKKYTITNDIDGISFFKRMTLVYNEYQMNEAKIQEKKEAYSKSVAIISSKTIQSMGVLFGIVSSLQSNSDKEDSYSLMRKYSDQVKSEYYDQDSNIKITDAVVGNMVFFELTSNRDVENTLVQSIGATASGVTNKDIYLKYYLMGYDDPLITLGMLCHYTNRSFGLLDEINRLRSLKGEKPLRNHRSMHEYDRVLQEWIVGASSHDITQWIDHLGTLFENVDSEVLGYMEKERVYEILEKITVTLFYKLLLNNGELSLQQKLYSFQDEEESTDNTRPGEIIDYYTNTHYSHISERFDDKDILAKKELRMAIESFENLDNILDGFEDDRIIVFLRQIKEMSNTLYDDCMNVLEDYIFNEGEDLVQLSAHLRGLSKMLLVLRGGFTVESVRKKVSKCIELFQDEQRMDDVLLVGTSDLFDEDPDLDASLFDEDILFEEFDGGDDILEISDNNPND